MIRVKCESSEDHLAVDCWGFRPHGVILLEGRSTYGVMLYLDYGASSDAHSSQIIFVGQISIHKAFQIRIPILLASGAGYSLSDFPRFWCFSSMA